MGCEYANKEMICSITETKCIFSKYCSKTQSFTFNDRLNSNDCAYKKSKEKETRMKQADIPKGTYLIDRVIQNKKGHYMVIINYEDNESRIFWFKDDSDFIKEYKKRNQSYVYVTKDKEDKLILSLDEKKETKTKAKRTKKKEIE